MPTREQQAFLDEEPSCDYGIALICAAYIRLSTERPLGYGCVGPIPWSKVEEWAQNNGYDDETTFHVMTVISMVDAETMRRQTKK